MSCLICARRLLVVLLIAMNASVSWAATFTVNDTGDDWDANPGNGICATAGAVCTLRAAIHEANFLAGADIITLPAGTYNLTDVLNPWSAITINGAGAATTIIDGQGYQVFYVDGVGTTVTVNNVTIREGYASAGGGVYAGSSTTVNLVNTIITNNVSITGSAMGGGIYVQSGGVLHLVDSTVSLNTATNGGGGIRIATGGTAEIVRSTISGNDAYGVGASGGGIESQGDLALLNSTISGNTTASGGYGQGLAVTGGTASLVNVTIAANNLGAGNQVRLAAGTTTMKATLIANPLAGTNCSFSVGAILTEQGDNFDSGTSCGFSGVGSINNTNPNLGPLANNGGPTQTHALIWPSQAIDAVPSAGAPGNDQRGVLRPQGADSDIGAYEYDAFAPEIGITGNANSIADGDVTPSLADHTDFGNTTISTPVSRTYTIGNSGAATLTLGASAVTLSGAGCGEFSVTAQPATTVAAAGSTTFTVQYLPTNVGTDTCTVNVNNDDADENPYNFAIQGTGAAAPEINITGNAIAIADGDVTPSLTDHTDFGTTAVGAPVTRTYTISNLGTAVLNLGANAVTLTGAGCGEFTVTVQPPTTLAALFSTGFSVQYLPTNPGTDTCTVNVNSDDADENPYNFVIQGAADPGAEIDITGNSVSIVDGDATPSLADWTDFGTTTVGTPVTRNFSIHNPGTAALTLGANAVSLSGAGCGEFTVAVQPPVSVPASGTMVFQIQYFPTNPGTDTCTVNVNSDDADENPYNFVIQGNAAEAPALGAAAIPTLSPWSLGLLAGFLGLAFYFGQRRRRH